MVEALIAVVLAALGAISIIAYRHPKGYAKMFKAISEFILCAFVAVAGFAVGVDVASKELARFIAPGNAAAAANAMARITPDPLWTLLLALLIWGFFVFLSRLPQILEHYPDDKIER